MTTLGTATILRADARVLPLSDESVDLIVTSPPYYGLRSYTDGGEHYDGQIGAEATPAEYISNLIDCTREWMRVIKPSGSIFVNLGDSYARNGGGGKGSSDGQNNRAERPSRRKLGQDMTREDAAWLAGVIDSDGSVSIHVNKQQEGRAPSFVAWVRIGQMRPEVVQRAAEVTGIGQVYQDARGVWNWSASAQQARWVLARIHPWLLIKRRQALAAIEVARHVENRNGRGEYRPLTADDVAYRQRLRDAVLTWNAGGSDDLVPPTPAAVVLSRYPLQAREKSLMALPELYRIACIYELGLIARAVVVWSKPNGLPESVTDRTRRSHEDWVHLVKQPRYFAAVDEIREPHATAGLARRAYGFAVNDAQRASKNPVLNGAGERPANPLGKLPGSVWEIPTEPLTVPDHLGVDHFAAFPTEWPRRIILGWSPSGICTACDEGRRPVAGKAPWWEAYKREHGIGDYLAGNGLDAAKAGKQRAARNGIPEGPKTVITGYACACPDTSSPTRPAVVVDPFGGTGTVALVAKALGRHGISVDMSADYCRLATWRTTDPGELAKAMRVPKPPKPVDGQVELDLFGGAA